MKDKIYMIIYNWVAENFGTSEAEEPSWDIHALAEELATKVELKKKFYQAEMEVFDFMKGYHTLKEWANSGINKVVYNGHEFWDGHNFDGTPITDEQNNEAGLLMWDYKDYDEDGYMYVVLEKVED